VRQPAVAPLGVAPPGAEVDLVDRHRGVERLPRAAVPEPLVVAPVVPGEVPDLGGCVRPNFGGEPVGVSLVHPVASVAVGDGVLVYGPGADVGNEALPQPGRADVVERVSALPP